MFSEYPPQVRVSTERSDLFYVQAPGYYAVHNRKPNAPAPKAVLLFKEGSIAVFKGEPDEEEIPLLSPVYRLGQDGPLAVPTGLIFIRFREETQAETRQEEINQAGYKIVQTLSYALNAAWLEARSGSFAEALRKVHLLENITAVENVEPQMLRQKVQRS